MNIVIIGNTSNFDIANALLCEKRINIIAGIVDDFTQELAERQRDFLLNNSIAEISYEDVDALSPDICLIIACNKIIPTQYFKNTLLLNIHGGILPKWRGVSTNAWAVMNGECEVGYSLHEASDILDGGNIYFVYKTKIGDDEKYGEVIPRLRCGMIENLPDILLRILRKELKPESQEGKMHLYTPRLKACDGIINNWDKCSRYIYNLYRVMGAPFGTGVYFIFRNKTYEITKMSLVDLCPDYIGIPGAIVYIGKNFMYVKTADNVIKIDEVICNNIPVELNKEFKIGMRL